MNAKTLDDLVKDIVREYPGFVVPDRGFWPVNVPMIEYSREKDEYSWDCDDRNCKGEVFGIGVGMVIHFGGCVDGTESVAIVISKKTSFSVGQIVLAFNLIIFGVAGFRFGVDRALYSLLTYFITSKVVDFVSTGLQQAKAAMIITEKSSKLSKEIYDKLGRTTTTIKGKGLISGEKEVLYCVLTRIEVFELKRIVEEMDESAFVTITDVSDIIGNHIKSNNKIKKLS